VNIGIIKKKELIIALFVTKNSSSKENLIFFISRSNSKFDSGCGWPSFYEAEKDKIDEKSDYSYGMIRTEVVCSNVGFQFLL